MTDDVTFAIEDGVQIIRLNRPAKKNAITAQMYTAIGEALAVGDRRDDVAVHVVLGAPGTFSAGSDIVEFIERAKGRTELSGPILQFIRDLPKVERPMLAAVDGMAVGVGTTMLLHFDLVYASPSATFRTPFLDLGLVPEAGSSMLAPARMGYARAFELLALGETFTAERALQAGLVNAIHPSAEVEAVTLAAARRLARKPPRALALCRQLMRSPPELVGERIEREAEIFARRLVSPEAAEAFAAFVEKRSPDFARIKEADRGSGSP